MLTIIVYQTWITPRNISDALATKRAFKNRVLKMNYHNPFIFFVKC